MSDNNILIFCPTVPDKKCHFPAYFYTHLCIYLIKETVVGPVSSTKFENNLQY